MITITKEGRRGKFYFIDKNGNKSNSFYFAGNYNNGFAIVRQTKKSPVQHRDLLGRLSDKPTDSGKAFYDFCEGTAKLKDINVLYFAEKTFCEGIKDTIIEKLKIFAKNEFNAGKTLDKEKYEKRVENNFKYIDSAHVAALAAIAKTEKEQAERKRQEFEAKKAEALEKKARVEAYQNTINFLNSFKENNTIINEAHLSSHYDTNKNNVDKISEEKELN